MKKQSYCGLLVLLLIHLSAVAMQTSDVTVQETKSHNKMQEIAEAKDIMTKNIDAVLADHPEAQTTDGGVTAAQFYKQANGVAVLMYRQNAKKCCCAAAICFPCCPCFSVAALYSYMKAKICERQAK